MIKVLVTGSEGFIGKRLFYKLSENDDFIVDGLDSNYFKSDVWQLELKQLLNNFKPNVIFHVGACSNTLEKDVNFMFERNYQSTKIIAEWSWINNAKLIYSSSAANYGTNGETPINLYGWSKYAGEDIVKLYGGISLRYFNVYGPGEERKGDMASIAYQMYNKHKNNEEILLFPGKPSRDFVYIDDVIDSNIFTLEHYDELYESNNELGYFDVGSGESRTFEDILNLLDIPFSYTEAEKIPSGYQYYTISDPSYWIPGWEPNYTIDTGITNYKKYLDKK